MRTLLSRLGALLLAQTAEVNLFDIVDTVDCEPLFSFAHHQLLLCLLVHRELSVEVTDSRQLLPRIFQRLLLLGTVDDARLDRRYLVCFVETRFLVQQQRVRRLHLLGGVKHLDLGLGALVRHQFSSAHIGGAFSVDRQRRG